MSKMTEDVSRRFSDLDLWITRDAVETMYEGQLAAMAATGAAVKDIAIAADEAASRLEHSGRLIYAGAGTSGRLAVFDGVELGPTFGWPAERLHYCLAGGDGALTLSAEGAEDNAQAGADQIAKLTAGTEDILIGVSACGFTPFTLGALKEANTRGTYTIGIANNPDTPVILEARRGILAETGSELVAGSTRMKAGTAQKAILNMLSTAIMLRLGRVYKGYMVDMFVSNLKLERRATRMVAEIANVTDEVATKALNQSDMHIKTAILVALGTSVENSRTILSENNGDLRLALCTLGAE